MANDLTRPGTNKQWTSSQLTLMRWLILPASKRKPDTKEQLAEMLGVHRNTLLLWEAAPGFKDAQSKLALQAAWHRLPKIMQASFDNMTKPEGWQERVAYFRYLLPALSKMDDIGYLDEIKSGAEQATIGKPMLDTMLANYDDTTRTALLAMLEELGYAENNPEPDASPDTVITTYDIEVEDTLPAQPVIEASRVNGPMPGSGKPKRRAKRSYTVRKDVKPLR